MKDQSTFDSAHLWVVRDEGEECTAQHLAPRATRTPEEISTALQYTTLTHSSQQFEDQPVTESKRSYVPGSLQLLAQMLNSPTWMLWQVRSAPVATIWQLDL